MAERGSALLAVLVFGLALVLVSTVLSEIARQAAFELVARRDALCARYAAVGGLALGPAHSDLAPAMDGTQPSVSVWYQADERGRCLLRSRGRCGSAERTLDRAADDPLRCGRHR